MKRPITLRDLRIACLALVPMASAVAGGVIDERVRLGYSQWQLACRSAGLNLGSLLIFTCELLPAAILGALLGGLVLVVCGATLFRHGTGARHALAAHAGCMLAMPAGLLLCVSSSSTPLMLGAESLLAVMLALLFRCHAVEARPAASVGLRTSGAPSA